MLVASVETALGATNFAQSPTDPRIDAGLQAQLEALYVSDPYGGDAGRTRWKEDGRRAEWILRTARYVRQVAPKYGLPPTPTDVFVTAHAAISTGYGRSRIARVAGNLFGIKANNAAAWPGPVIYSMTTEYKDGEPYRTATLWRVYRGSQAVDDHLRLVMSSDRYAKSAAMLRAGNLDYMAQLGRDGWYTAPTGEIDAMWRSAMKIIASTIQTAPPVGRPRPKTTVALLGLAILAGVGYLGWRDGWFT